MSTIPQPPCSADTLRHAFDAACDAHTEGRLQRARQQYLALLGYLPDSALIHYNLGLVYFDLEAYPQALQEFSLADGLAPPDTDTLFNMALSHKNIGDRPSAIATYLRMLAMEPDHVDGLYNLGGCYRDQYDNQEAIACYQRVLELNPAYLPAIGNLAYIHHRVDENEQAIHYYSQVLEQRPDDESVHYLLAALLGIPLTQAPDDYVRDFFDSYAQDFEHSLVSELEYDTPRQLLGCLSRSSAQGTQCAHGLDLGCGTGLSGTAFKAMVNVLDGVDLSTKMLAQAAGKECYVTLHPDSILHHLTSTLETYDLFLATDVFIYVGDLMPIFTAVQAVARPGSLFCFSTEHLENHGYRLLPSGRFAYAPAYIRKTAAATGWTVLIRESARLRRERALWITGDLWILRLSDDFPWPDGATD